MWDNTPDLMSRRKKPGSAIDPVRPRRANKPAVPTAGNPARRALLMGVALAALGLPHEASAQDATWTGATADFNTGAHWNSGTVPTGTAFFGASGASALTLSTDTVIGGWTFNTGAQDYNFETNSYLLSFTGTGITINGGSATITNGGNTYFYNSSSAGNAAITNNFTLVFNDTSSAGSATITNNSAMAFLDSSVAGTANISNNQNLYFFGTSAAGTATITNNGSLFFSDSASAGSATITNSSLALGGLSFGGTSTAGGANITNNSTLAFADSSTASSAAITNNNTLLFYGTSTAGGATIINNSVLSFNGSSTAGSANISNNDSLTFADTSSAGSATITNGRNLDFSNTSTADSATIANNYLLSFAASSTAGGANIINNSSIVFADTSTAGSATITNGGDVIFIGSSTAGSAAITNNNTLLFYDTSTAGGATIINNSGVVDFGHTSGPSNDHKITAGSISGGGNFYLGNNELTLGANNLSTHVSGVIADGCSPIPFSCDPVPTGASLIKIGAGALTLSGLNTYTGETGVNGGSLIVNGSIATSSMTNVNAGGILSGTGTVGNTTVAGGGIFAPGNGTAGSSMTVQGSLAFQSGAFYLVQINPSTASSTSVSNTATLGGATVNAAFAPGSYVQKKYTILTATGGVSGAFAGPVNTDLPTNFNSSLSYDANNAYLDLNLSFAVPSGLNGNQQAVANTLTNFFNTTGGIPLAFGALTPQGLSQASGELATGSQQATFDAMNMFMGVMTDPSVAGRGEGFNSSTGGASQYAGEGDALSYAANGKRRSSSERDAYAAIWRKAAPRTFEERWSVWGVGYGGSQTTTGNAVTGSNTATSSIYGGAAGADYHLSSDTLVGFALAGGGTSFNVAGSGTGRSDLFQAGAFLRHEMGPAYITAAMAYGWQNITTDRTVTAAGVDRLHASFDANAYSSRVESGYLFISPAFGGIGLTPYVAGQVTLFDLPSYSEQALSGSNQFALSYTSKDVTSTRSELGLHADKSFALDNAILTLRGRAAWAHNFDSDHAIGATFQALPGASFVVNGAAQANDSALITASAETKWLNGWSLAGTFEGEFSSLTNFYAGKGVVRYAW